MAAFKTFTITQPFLGAPLQFQPALGSKELEELIDAYVLGSAPHNDKLSEVTIDFFNNATVDLNTGARVRRYDVFAAPWLNQSPVSQSPFTPPMFTPSPASSANFADSGYGSISMTPPALKSTQGRARVAKKPKKDTKKTAEIRLPGFSIMTKDGIDVTNCASRGTKTKEQREHAHLMRIMKACDDCKRKKIRCDPSHRRSSHTDMSRTSTTSTTKTSSPPGNSDPSPTVSVPSLSFDIAQASQENSPADFSADFQIDDFVLFPEDDLSAWNPADMSIPGFENQDDLGRFNFDLNDFSSNMSNYSSFGPPSNFQSYDQNFDQPFDHNHFNPQLGLDQWPSGSPVMDNIPYHSIMNNNFNLFNEPLGELPVSHSRPHPSSSAQDSGQLDSFVGEQQPDNLQGSLPVTHSRHPLSTSTQGSGHLDSNSVPGLWDSTAGPVFRDPIWPPAATQATDHGGVIPRSSLSSDAFSPSDVLHILSRQSSQSSEVYSPAGMPVLTPQWSQSSGGFSPSPGLQVPSPQSIQLSQRSQSSENVSPSTSLQLPTPQSSQSPAGNSLSRAVAASLSQAIPQSDIISEDYSTKSGYSPHSSSWADEPASRGHAESVDKVHRLKITDRSIIPSDSLHQSRTTATSQAQAQGYNEEIGTVELRSTLPVSALFKANDVVAQLLKLLCSRKNLSSTIQSLQTELRQLHSLLLTASASPPSTRLITDLQAVEHSLRDLFSPRTRPAYFNRPDPEIHIDHLKECQAGIRQLVRSLCATIPSLEASADGSGADVAAPSPEYSLPRLSSTPRTIYDRLVAQDVSISASTPSNNQQSSTSSSNILASSPYKEVAVHTTVMENFALADVSTEVSRLHHQRLVARESYRDVESSLARQTRENVFDENSNYNDALIQTSTTVEDRPIQLIENTALLTLKQSTETAILRQERTTVSQTHTVNTALLLTLLTLLFTILYSFSSQGSGTFFTLARMACLSVMMAKTPGAICGFIGAVMALSLDGLNKTSDNKKKVLNIDTPLGRTLMDFIDVLS